MGESGGVDDTPTTTPGSTSIVTSSTPSMISALSSSPTHIPD